MVHPSVARAAVRRLAAGQTITSPGIDETASPNRVACWFSARLHRLSDLVGA